MKKIAYIYSNYYSPSMYYVRWPEQLKNAEFETRPYSLVGKDHRSHVENTTFYFEGLSNKLRRSLNFLLNGRTNIFQWIRYQQNTSLYHKLKSLAEYGNLIIYDPDIIHFVNSTTFIKTRNFQLNKPAKLIASFHGHDIVKRPYTDPLWNAYLKELFERADCLHFVSDWLKRRALELGAPEKKCQVIYAGVDSTFFSPGKTRQQIDLKRSVQIVSTGRLVKLKGHEYVLQAVKKLINLGLDVDYCVIGKGEDLDRLSRMAADLHIESKVHFLGIKSKNQLKEILALADIFLHPSLTEALGNAVLEACSMGLPVIASAVGGIPEIIQNNHNGLLIEPEDPDAIVAAVIRLINNSEQAQEMGQAARQTILTKFSIQNETLRWHALYQQVLSH